MKGDEDEAVEGGWEESQRGMRFADPLPSSGRPVRARAGMGGVSLSLSRPCVCARLSALVLPSRERAVARESSVCCCVRSGQCARLRKQKQKKNLLLSLCYKTFKEKYKSVCFSCGRWTQTTGGTR